MFTLLWVPSSIIQLIFISGFPVSVSSMSFAMVAELLFGKQYFISLGVPQHQRSLHQVLVVSLRFTPSSRSSARLSVHYRRHRKGRIRKALETSKSSFLQSKSYSRQAFPHESRALFHLLNAVSTIWAVFHQSILEVLHLSRVQTPLSGHKVPCIRENRRSQIPTLISLCLPPNLATCIQESCRVL